MLKEFLAFFDKFEDGVRKRLSHRPLFYAFIGGTGVVLFWRGIWHTMDFIMERYLAVSSINQSIDSNLSIWWDGPLSIVIGLVMLLMTGIFTSSFIGNEIIISGIRGEKKMVEKTELEMKSEAESMNEIKKEIKIISDRFEKIEQKLGEKENKRIISRK
ncbi:MAG: hypothetical protein Q7S18_00935 [bacterium]|nr:hypothetical protein [bacterium]